MKIRDDDLLIIMRALYWYYDKMLNKVNIGEDFVELENINALRESISKHIKEEAFLL